MYKVSIDKKAAKELKRINKIWQQKILSFLKKIDNSPDPRIFGKSLKGNLQGLWRYRVGDYRIICQINDDELMVLVVKTGHRKGVYNKK